MKGTLLAAPTLGLLLAVAIVALGATSGAARNDAKDKPAVATVTVTETGVADIEKAVAGHKGSVVLVDVWATWCGPCVKKFPDVVSLHKAYKDTGLVVVSVSLDAGRRGYKLDAVAKFLGDQRATFPNFVAAGPKPDLAALTRAFGLGDGIPYQTLFDKTGKRVWDSDAKALTYRALADRIEVELKK